MLSDLRESGCLAGDTLIHLPECGGYASLRELAGNSGFLVTSLNPETLKLERSPVTAAFGTGTKPIWRIETQLGRAVKATANHRFLTIHGWKRLDELTVGEHIALPRQLPNGASCSMTYEQLGLLGHLLGDGCVLPTHAIQYTTRERDLAELVVHLAKTVFGDAITPRIRQEHRWYQVYLAATEHLTRARRNPVSSWFYELGIANLRSYEKHVPSRVFEQSTDGIATFLRHLWTTDGCIRMTWGRSPRPAVYYATSSQTLAEDVQSLLLRLAINARIRRVAQALKGRDQFHVIIGGQEDILRFSHSVGVVSEYKQQSLEAILEWTKGRHPNTNRDVIPRAVWRTLVAPAMAKHGLSTREMQARLNMEYCGTSLYQANLSRDRMKRVADVVGLPVLSHLAESDVYWDRVRSVEYAGEEDVYDLTVSDNHNFVAGNIIVHNSIEQDADVVLFIYRDDYYDEDSERQNIADVIVAKHRHGSTGSVSLYFRKELTQFRDLEMQRTELSY
jgi:replicative DNA helicase